MNPELTQTQQRVRLEPITLRNLGSWAKRTVDADRRTHSPTLDRWSAGRLWRIAFPSLRRPVFVIGSPRSGTTFFGECLTALPEISYHHEPVATKAAARYVYTGDWPAWKARGFYRVVFKWLVRIHGEGHLRFAEKTPCDSFLVPFLADTFGDAQFIHLIRDGRDVAVSYIQKPWLQAAAAPTGKREPGGYPYGPTARFWVETDRIREFETTTDLHRCIWAWRRHTEAGLRASRLLPSERYTEVRYEHLVADPVGQTDRVTNFLGITAPASQHRFAEVADRVTPTSVGRWRTALDSEELEMIEREAGSLLAELGYA